MLTRKTLLSSVVALGLLAGCGASATEPYRDAPQGKRYDGPADIYSMPDGFSNFAGKCDGHGHRVFVAFKGGDNRAAITAIDDASCNP